MDAARNFANIDGKNDPPDVIIPIDNCCCRGIFPPKFIKTYHFDNTNLDDFKTEIVNCLKKVNKIIVANYTRKRFGNDNIKYIQVPNILLQNSDEKITFDVFKLKVNEQLTDLLSSIIECEQMNKYIKEYCKFSLHKDIEVIENEQLFKGRFCYYFFGSSNDNHLNNITSQLMVDQEEKKYYYDNISRSFKLVTDEKENLQGIPSNNSVRINNEKISILNSLFHSVHLNPMIDNMTTGLPKLWKKH